MEGRNGRRRAFGHLLEFRKLELVDIVPGLIKRSMRKRKCPVKEPFLFLEYPERFSDIGSKIRMVR